MCSRHNVFSRRKNLRKRLAGGSLAPLCGGVGVCISLGCSDAAGTTTGWQLAQSTHCFGWSRLQKPNTHKDLPTNTWAELPQAGQENSPWKEGAAVISPAGPCSSAPQQRGETLPKRGMASSGTEAAICPRGHIRLSLLVRGRAPWSQPSFGCSQESPGHGSGWAVPQEPLPALCCIPEPHFRSRALQVLFLEWYCDGI